MSMDGVPKLQFKAIRGTDPQQYCEEVHRAMRKFPKVCWHATSALGCAKCQWRVKAAKMQLSDSQHEKLEATWTQDKQKREAELDEFTFGVQDLMGFVDRAEPRIFHDEEKVRALLGLGPPPPRKQVIAGLLLVLDKRRFGGRPSSSLCELHMLDISKRLGAIAATRPIEAEVYYAIARSQSNEFLVESGSFRSGLDVVAAVDRVQHEGLDAFITVSEFENAVGLAGLVSQVSRSQIARAVGLMQSLDSMADGSESYSPRADGVFRLSSWKRASEHSVVPVHGLAIKEGDDVEWTFCVHDALDDLWPWEEGFNSPRTLKRQTSQGGGTQSKLDPFRGIFLGTTLKPILLGPHEACSSLSGICTNDGSVWHFGHPCDVEGRVLGRTSQLLRDSCQDGDSAIDVIKCGSNLLEAPGPLWPKGFGGTVRVRMGLDRSPIEIEPSSADVAFHSRLWMKLEDDSKQPRVIIESMNLGRHDVVYPAVYASRPCADVLGAVKISDCKWLRGGPTMAGGKDGRRSPKERFRFGSH